MENAPIVKKGSGLSPIWVLPLVALCISGWLLYSSIRDAGIPVTIHFENAEGITAGKTQVMYKGVAVGLVEEIIVDEDLQGVSLRVKMEKKARRGVVKDSKFWIVRPEISAGKISGLETILSGSYIAVQPGSSVEFAKYFEGLSEAPTLPADSPGLHLTLMSDALYSLQKGSPVYTRNLKIGKVLKYYLAEDRSVLIDIYIEPEFTHLIQIGTRFWNSSGFSVEGSLQSGFSVKFQSMAALVYGGISCATPEPLAETSPSAINGLVYKLYSDYAAAEYGIPMSLQLASGEGIVEGKTKVMYRGLEAGVVQKIVVKVHKDREATVTAEILLDPRAEPILKKNTRFWVTRPEVSLGGISSLDALVGGAYITFLPGDGVYRDQFVVEKEPMPRQIIRDGIHFTLVSQENRYLESGSPILYNGLPVGEVYEITFGEDGQTIETDILIYAEYRHLVNDQSVFWNISSVSLDASFAHVRLDFGTIKSILKGGISFTNPEEGDVAVEGTSFPLYADLAEATKTVEGLYPAGMVLHLQTQTDTFYQPGSPVLYKKVPVGEVIGYRLDDALQSITFDVLIFDKFSHLVNRSSLFYNNSGFTINAQLSGLEIHADDISSILAGGIAFVTQDKAAAVASGHTFELYEDYAAAKESDNVVITLHLGQAEGITKSTKIKYQGVEIGSVKDVRFGPMMKDLIATARVQKEAAVLFREKSKLWLTGPTIGLNGVQNISTMLTGPFISVVKGDGELTTEFTVHQDEPRIDVYTGLNIILEAPSLGFLSIGNPVYYRQIKVGQVTGYDLSPTAQKVLVKVNIYPEYGKLVSSDSKFWLSSGIRASWDFFSGLKLDTESVEALLTGGISFATPEPGKMSEHARNGDHFTLHSKKDIEWTTWAPELTVFSMESPVDKPADSQ